MTKEREALTMALEALEKMDNCCPAIDPSGQDAHDTAYQTMHILRTVINEAQPEQEPECVAVINVLGKDWRLEQLSLPVGKHKLYAQQYTYTAPPRREWVGLTKDEVTDWDLPEKPTVFEFAKFVEAKLKEKNI